MRLVLLILLLTLACGADERTWKTGWSREELEDALRTAPILTVTPVREVQAADWDGSNDYHVVKLEGGLKALFRSEDEPWGSQAEVAGYRMDRWLGTELVPPTVERTLTRRTPGYCWRQDERPGSLQLWIETGPRSVTPLADVEVLSFVMGRYDNHPGNLLYDRAGLPVVVDFESAMDIQQVRYGDFPFVRRGGWHKGGGDGPFPFAHPFRLKDPSLAEIKRALGPWWNQTWPEGMVGLHRMLANIPQRIIPYAIWENRLWVQVRVRARHPACTPVYREATIARLRQLDAAALDDILVPPMGEEHALGILDRASQVLKACAGHGRVL